MAIFIPGVNLAQIVDGKWTLEQAWSYYTMNVSTLQTISHEQYCLDFPESAREIERASKIWDKWDAMMKE